jgi:Family of unknown function (DUF6090)
MAKNKPTKYLAYAAGEIILVVLGILIALSISNNNDIKKLRQEEQRYLLALKEEFLFNKAELERVKRINLSNLNSALEITNYTGPEKPELTEKEFDILFGNTINNEVQFNPSPGVLNEIINSGKMGNFSNGDLKKALASWEAILKRVQFQENEEVLRSRTDLLAFTIDKSNWRRATFNELGIEAGISKTKFKGNNLSLLQNEEFENLIVQFLFVSSYLDTSYYPRLEKAIDNILELVERDIEQ